MEKQTIENLILFFDHNKQFIARDHLLDVYIKLYPQEFGECCLYELMEKNNETVH
jgi:hypothetical protein